jgi:RNA polymerase sigma-70 factor (ECF subfamily)
MAEPKTEPQAVSGTQAKPADAFEAIFRTHWNKVCSLIYRLVGDPDEAEDLALETFWRLYRTFRDGSPGANPGGWLYRVAVNLGYNHLRARTRRTRYEQEAGKLVLDRSGEENTAADAEKRIEAQLVRKALAGMKQRSAQILVLRHSGVSYAEIAAALNISPGSVGKLLARAEQEFERSYRKMEGSEL